jgi:hypothetical protein
VSFRRLVLCFTFLAIFTMAVRISIDSDTWWHLAAGKVIVETGEIIREDPFSLTRQGQSWNYPGWLAQIVLYGFYEWLGYQGLILLTALFVVMAFAFIWPLLQGPPLMRASTMLLAASVSAVYWSARPQIMSFALAGAFFLLLSKVRQGNRRLAFLLPVLMALWTNLHGGFAIGFIFIFSFLLGEAMEAVDEVVRKGVSFKAAWLQHRDSFLLWTGSGLACVVAVIFNPNGAQMLLYPFKTVSVGALQDFIQEWQSPNFHHLETQPFLWMILLLLASLAFSKKDVSWVSLILVIGFTYLSLVAARNIALFALVAAPFLCEHGYAAIQPFIQHRKQGRQVPERIARLLNLIILALMLLAAGVKIMLPLNQESIQDAISEHNPVLAVGAIRDEELYGNLFNSYNWGGYVIWALYPDWLSFVDGRTDLFDDEILEDYITAWRADPGWQEILADWKIEVTLLERESPLAKVLVLSGWEIRYEDDDAVVLTHGYEP